MVRVMITRTTCLLLLLLKLLLVPLSTASEITYCILTSPRPATSYLSETLRFLIQEGADASAIMIMDASKSGSRMMVDVNCSMYPISCEVQQMSLDVVLALRTCAEHTTDWVVLIEDDVQACPGSIPVLVSTLRLLPVELTKFAKFSKFGLANAFPKQNISPYTNYVIENLHAVPHDLLISSLEWGPVGRPYYYYIHPTNLFHHLGQTSTIPERNDPLFIAMYADLRSDVCGEALT